MKMIKNKIDTFFLFITTIASLNFYDFILMPKSETISKVLYYIAGISSFIYFLTQKSSTRKPCHSSIGKNLAFLIFIMFISIFSSNIFENQGLPIGLITTFPYIFTLFFFYILQKGRVSSIVIERLIKIFGTIFIIVFLLDKILPVTFFGTMEFDYDRGEARIRVPGMQWLLLLFLYGIQQYKNTYKKKFLLVILLCFVIIIFSLTRQIILISAAMGLWLYFRNSKLKNKIIIGSLIIIVSSIIFPKIPALNNMMDLTRSQFEKNKYEDEYIRFQAWDFYTKDYDRNLIQSLIGCGVPSVGNSVYGNKIDRLSRSNNYYVHDVGWAGFYFFFGLLGTISLVYIMIKSIKIKCPEKNVYMRFYIMAVALLGFASGSVLYYNELLCLTLAFYYLSIVDKRMMQYGCLYNNR